MAHCPNGPVSSLACGPRSVVISLRAMAGGMRSRSLSLPSKRSSRRPDRFREGYLVNVNLRSGRGTTQPSRDRRLSVPFTCTDAPPPPPPPPEQPRAPRYGLHRVRDSRVIGERDTFITRIVPAFDSSDRAETYGALVLRRITFSSTTTFTPSRT